MTDISLETVGSYQSEKRSWILSQWGLGPGENPGITLDISAFTKATHYPNGYLLSGIPLGLITATGLYGPYDDTAVDGTAVCKGFLMSATKVPDLTDLTKNAGGALVACGFIKLSNLPVTLDANGQADLKLCHFTA